MFFFIFNKYLFMCIKKIESRLDNEISNLNEIISLVHFLIDTNEKR